MFIALVRVYIFIHLLVIVSDFKMPFNNMTHLDTIPKMLSCFNLVML